MSDESLPIPATPEALRKTLGRRPALWVGAGASIAAGLPSTGKLVDAMVAEADGAIDPGLSFEQVADAFVGQQGEGHLKTLLQRLIGAPAGRAGGMPGLTLATPPRRYGRAPEINSRRRGLPDRATAPASPRPFRRAVRGAGRISRSMKPTARLVLASRVLTKHVRMKGPGGGGIPLAPGRR